MGAQAQMKAFAKYKDAQLLTANNNNNNINDEKPPLPHPPASTPTTPTSAGGGGTGGGGGAIGLGSYALLNQKRKQIMRNGANASPLLSMNSDRAVANNSPKPPPIAGLVTRLDLSHLNSPHVTVSANQNNNNNNNNSGNKSNSLQNIPSSVARPPPARAPLEPVSAQPYSQYQQQQQQHQQQQQQQLQQRRRLSLTTDYRCTLLPVSDAVLQQQQQQQVLTRIPVSPKSNLLLRATGGSANAQKSNSNGNLLQLGNEPVFFVETMTRPQRSNNETQKQQATNNNINNNNNRLQQQQMGDYNVSGEAMVRNAREPPSSGGAFTRWQRTMTLASNVNAATAIAPPVMPAHQHFIPEHSRLPPPSPCTPKRVLSADSGAHRAIGQTTLATTTTTTTTTALNTNQHQQQQPPPPDE